MLLLYMKIIKTIFCVLFVVAITQSKAQDLHVYESVYLPKADSTLVFKPKSYTQEQQYPLIFLLHGYSGNHKQWDAIMDAQKYADQYGFIIVLPDGLYNSWYLNSPAIKNSQFEKFFIQELYEDILKKYQADSNNIFISGLSMGGHGALSIFLNNMDKFKSAGSTSGAVDLSDLGNKYGINLLFNEDKSSVLRAFSVAGNLNKMAGSDKEIIFDSGDQDQFYAMNNALKLQADALKIKATYISQPGGHNRQYWTKSIKQHFDFFKRLTLN